MLDLAAQIESAASFVARTWPVHPRVGLILGTGLAGVAAIIRREACIPYHSIPNFPESTAMGHRGVLTCGHVGPMPVMAMDGRFHVYEGYSPQAVTLPVRLMKRLGVELLIISNASGGLNPDYASGDVMVLVDQINLTWRSPLWGINDRRLGPRFPDMCSPFDESLIDAAVAAGRLGGFACHQGVYAGLTGPTYETRAEYRMLRQLGADVVGMSTIPEVIVAVHAGMKVCGISAVTNLCRPDRLESTSGEAVKAAAEAAAPKVRSIVEALLGGVR